MIPFATSTEEIAVLTSNRNKEVLDEISLSKEFAREFLVKEEEEINPSEILFKLLSSDKFKHYSISNDLIFKIKQSYGLNTVNSFKYLDKDPLIMISTLSKEVKTFYMTKLKELEENPEEQKSVFQNFKDTKEKIAEFLDLYSNETDTEDILLKAKKNKQLYM